MKTACILSVWIAWSLPAWAAETTAPPRAARSVHLGYPAPDAMLFYNEMTVLESTPGSYFMAAGWNTGYFGIQELSDGRKVILFSVWNASSACTTRPTCASGGSAARGPAASAWAGLTGKSARRTALS